MQVDTLVRATGLTFDVRSGKPSYTGLKADRGSAVLDTITRQLWALIAIVDEAHPAAVDGWSEPKAASRLGAVLLVGGMLGARPGPAGERSLPPAASLRSLPRAPPRSPDLLALCACVQLLCRRSTSPRCRRR